MPEQALRLLLEERYMNQVKLYRRFFTSLMAFETVILGVYIVVFNLYRHMVSSASYSWALTRPLMGYDSYSIIAIVAFICMASWFFRKPSPVLLVIGLAAFTWIQVMFGVSVLVATLLGQGSSIVAILQWIALPVVNILILATSGLPKNQVR